MIYKTSYFIFLILSVLSCSSTSKTNGSDKEKLSSAINNELLSSESCINGSQRMGYSSPIVNGNSKCVIVNQTCNSGLWSGPNLYDICDNPTESCGINPHGSTESGYMSTIAPCIQGTKVCIDGSWQGPQLYDTCN